MIRTVVVLAALLCSCHETTSHHHHQICGVDTMCQPPYECVAQQCVVPPRATGAAGAPTSIALSEVALAGAPPASWSPFLADDFADGVLRPEYIVVGAPTVIETDGCLQSSVETTDKFGILALAIPNASTTSAVRIRARVWLHQGEDPHSAAIITLHDDRALAYSLSFGYNGAHEQSGTWITVSNDVSPIYNINTGALFEVWIAFELTLAFRAGTIDYRDDQGSTAHLDIAPASPTNLTFAFSAYGWFTKHVARLDDLRIEQRFISEGD